jgi:hypothetical protein
VARVIPFIRTRDGRTPEISGYIFPEFKEGPQPTFGPGPGVAGPYLTVGPNLHCKAAKIQSDDRFVPFYVRPHDGLGAYAI